MLLGPLSIGVSVLEELELKVIEYILGWRYHFEFIYKLDSFRGVNDEWAELIRDKDLWFQLYALLGHFLKLRERPSNKLRDILCLDQDSSI